MLTRSAVRRLLAALFVVFVPVAFAAPAAAKFTPLDTFKLFSKTGLKTLDFPLPKGRQGLLIRTMRDPVLITDPKRIVLIMTYNGIDDTKWPYRRILGRVLKAACGIDSKTATGLIDQTYKQKSISPPRRLGGNGGTLVKRRHSVVRNGCRITVEVDGARWHRLTTTITKA